MEISLGFFFPIVSKRDSAFVRREFLIFKVDECFTLNIVLNI